MVIARKTWLLSPLKPQIPFLRAHLSPVELPGFPNRPSSGELLSKIVSRAGYPVTKGRAGGKLPTGKMAGRPCFNVSAAARKADTNPEYIL